MAIKSSLKCYTELRTVVCADSLVSMTSGLPFVGHELDPRVRHTACVMQCDAVLEYTSIFIIQGKEAN